MSLKILKAGILDTAQDGGRFGYQHFGINPGGAMDVFALQIANLLVGNKMNEPVLEFFFPAPEIIFEKNTLLTITGANFSPTINGDGIKMCRPVMVKKNTVIQFPQLKSGKCCYLSVRGGFKLSSWLNSNSTNTKAAAGGFEGRKLMKGDLIEFNLDFEHEKICKADIYKLPWRAAPFEDESGEDEIFVLPGNEWDHLTEESKNDFINKEFNLDLSSDRMGYKLKGENLETTNKEELVSSAVNFGTIQLLPNGETIVLMADSQTTGGYPRLAHIISAHLPKFSQKQPGQKVKFTIVKHELAEDLTMRIQLHLELLKNASNFRLQNLLL